MSLYLGGTKTADQSGIQKKMLEKGDASLKKKKEKKKKTKNNLQLDVTAIMFTTQEKATIIECFPA